MKQKKEEKIKRDRLIEEVKLELVTGRKGSEHIIFLRDELLIIELI